MTLLHCNQTLHRFDLRYVPVIVFYLTEIVVLSLDHVNDMFTDVFYMIAGTFDIAQHAADAKYQIDQVIAVFYELL